MKKQVEFWEVTVTFLVRKGSHSAESRKQLLVNVEGGIGQNEMNCIEAEEVKVSVK